MNANLVDYVMKNRGRYTDHALRAQLLQAGYAPAEIEATLADPNLGVRKADIDRRRAQVTVIVAVAFLVVFIVLAYGMRNFSYGGAVIASAILGVLLISGALGSSLVARRIAGNRAARGLVGGLVIALLVPFIVLVAIAGSCGVAVPPQFS